MREKRGILRGKSMKCNNCEEFYSNTIRCEYCDCVAQHEKVETAVGNEENIYKDTSEFMMWLTQTCTDTMQKEVEQNPFLDDIAINDLFLDEILKTLPNRDQSDQTTDLVAKEVLNKLYESSDVQKSNIPEKTGYVHPPTRYQPPRHMDRIVTRTKELVKHEIISNPFLAKIPTDFFERNLDSILKKIDNHQYKRNLPRLRQMEEEIAVGRLVEEVIEKLYDLDNGNDIDENEIKESIETPEINTEMNMDVSSDNEVKNLKKKWSVRRFLSYFVPCMKKSKKDDE